METLMCREQSTTHKVNYPVGQKRLADIPTATSELYERSNGTGLPKRLKNPKITNLLDEILNDNPRKKNL